MTYQVGFRGEVEHVACCMLHVATKSWTNLLSQTNTGSANKNTLRRGRRKWWEGADLETKRDTVGKYEGSECCRVGMCVSKGSCVEIKVCVCRKVRVFRSNIERFVCLDQISKYFAPMSPNSHTCLHLLQVETRERGWSILQDRLQDRDYPQSQGRERETLILSSILPFKRLSTILFERDIETLDNSAFQETIHNPAVQGSRERDIHIIHNPLFLFILISQIFKQTFLVKFFSRTNFLSRNFLQIFPSDFVAPFFFGTNCTNRLMGLISIV